LLIGVAIGTGIALLYAPNTGRYTRKYLRRKAEDARDSLADTGEQIRDTIFETGEQIRDAGTRAYRAAAVAAGGAADVIGRGVHRVRG
jgi:gas vesicle protein